MVYLIPSLLNEEGLDSIPPSVISAIRHCQVFFAENERSARRFFKKCWKEMVIDDYEWHTIHKAEDEVREIFSKRLKEGKQIGIVSEAGCPGIADPGQKLVALAHEAGVPVRPLAGPRSILLALMGSGMNGQQFRFLGYLPIDGKERQQAIRALENEARQTGCSQVFIETPYRNDQLLETLLKTCRPVTRLCIAADLDGPAESIRTQSISAWRAAQPALHKHLVVFVVGQ